jgi:hypothetical protein
VVAVVVAVEVAVAGVTPTILAGYDNECVRHARRQQASCLKGK